MSRKNGETKKSPAVASVACRGSNDNHNDFPCNNPVEPSLRDENLRLNTFGRWPFGHTVVPPRRFAQSGFYCLGFGDRTKCFYCGGGLKDWSRDDDPWVEHAKWYPECEFLLHERGPAWVSEITSRFPNIHRPNMTEVRRLAEQSRGNPQQQSSMWRGGNMESNIPSQNASIISQPQQNPELPRVPSFQRSRPRSPNLPSFNPEPPRRPIQPRRPRSPVSSLPQIPDPLPSSFPHISLYSRNYTVPNTSTEFTCNNPVFPSFANENDRLATFVTPSSFNNPWFSANQMTEAGFFHCRHNDQTSFKPKCFYCGKVLEQCVNHPWVEHAKLSPQCEFLLREKGRAWVLDVTQNHSLNTQQTISQTHFIGPWRSNSLPDIVPRQPRSDASPGSSPGKESFMFERCREQDIDKRGSRGSVHSVNDLQRLRACPDMTNPHMDSFQGRYETFIDWPYSKPSSESMADAGFIYSGEEDLVFCPICSGGLMKWGTFDDPWQYHAGIFSEFVSQTYLKITASRIYFRCDFVRENRDAVFIKDAIKKYGNGKAYSDK